MNKTIRLLAFIFLLILIIVFYSYQGLRMMGIDDFYGDLQDVYYNTDSGDSIINNINKKTGEILLENNRVYILSEHKKIDLFTFLDPNSKQKYNLTVFDRKSRKNIKLNLIVEY